MEDVRELELTEGEMEAAVDFTTACKSLVDQDMMASDWSVVLFQYFIVLYFMGLWVRAL